MAHDVFISYSAHDKPVADAVCATLESNGIRCWVAPRDIVPGHDWGAALVDAIRLSRVMVLVFSSHANASPQVRREVERAVHAGIVLVPFRIEDVKPEHALEYFLGTPHWLDALNPPLETHIARLVEAVGNFLAVGEPVSAVARGGADSAGATVAGVPDSSTEAGIAERSTLISEKSETPGANHPGTLGAREELARFLSKHERLEQAFTVYDELIGDESRILGAEHGTTVATRKERAALLDGIGRHSAAIEERQAVVAALTNTLGGEDPDTLRARVDLAKSVGNAGRSAECIGQLRAVVADQQTILGPEHPDTLASLNNLAVRLGGAGYLDEAPAGGR